MASHTIDMLGAGTIPDDSGDVFFQPYDAIDTAAVVGPLVLTFNNSGTAGGDSCHGIFTVPQNYSSSGTTQIQVIWTADNATTNQARYELAYLTRSGTDDMGAAIESAETANGTNDAHTGTAFQRNQTNIDVTEANFAAGEQVLFKLFRASDDAGDTLAAATLVFQVLFKYDDA